LPVILGQEVNIVKYETLKIGQFESLDESDVHQDTAIEAFLSRLFDDKYSA
jgi:hypothetical protein